MGEKAYFIAIPTTAGTGSEVTPFAVITDDKNGIKYPLADYELLPKMAIVDADMMMHAPKGLTAASGIDAVTHSLEADVSVMANDYCDGLAIRSLQMIFEYLPDAYHDGAANIRAREKMADAATMAGMAFANAFLGVCHSMAHKLGAYHHIPHGIANALLIEEVIRYNSSETPVKMGTFSVYDHPCAKKRYAEIAKELGVSGSTDDEMVEGLIAKIRALKEKIEIKPTIRDYGVDEQTFMSTLDEMSENAFDDQCTGANPRYPLIAEIRQMYLNAFCGKHETV
jgi:acetaldehyde dehydrogenase/alcohol dehydrogenase